MSLRSCADSVSAERKKQPSRCTRARHGTARHALTARHGTTRHGRARHGTARHDMANTHTYTSSATHTRTHVGVCARTHARTHAAAAAHAHAGARAHTHEGEQKDTWTPAPSAPVMNGSCGLGPGGVCAPSVPHLRRDCRHPPSPARSPHLYRNWAHPAHICAESGLNPPFPRPHICTGTGSVPARRRYRGELALL